MSDEAHGARRPIGSWLAASVLLCSSIILRSFSAVQWTPCIQCIPLLERCWRGRSQVGCPTENARPPVDLPSARN